MTHNTDLDWVNSHMPGESEQALARFTEANPTWRGSNWDDCLSALMDVDASLDIIEPLYADPFLAEMKALPAAVALTLAWASASFAEATPEQQMSMVKSTIGMDGVPS